MHIKQCWLPVVFCLGTLGAVNAVADQQADYAGAFQKVTMQSCDTTFHKLEKGCLNNMCQDLLDNAWAECWKKSMNTQLNKRLLKLKDSDPTEFHAEMGLQKTFNQATQNLCGKNCGPDGTMKGIPYNYCRSAAYKFRAEQADQINHNQLTISGKVGVDKSRGHKNKDTKFFNAYTEQLCHMPKNIWNNGQPPVDCQKNALAELDTFEFTDDVCNLS